MVEFEEIIDEQGDDFLAAAESEGAWSDTSSEGEEDDIDVGNETLYERIAALKDIIPAKQRASISRTISSALQVGKIATFVGGKAAYIIASSMLMVGIPFVLLLEEDRMFTEQERQMQMQQEMSEVDLSSFRIH